jgi:uncharacterized protein GlcG (DUF336 family)
MAEHLIPIYSSLGLAVASRITDEALRLRQEHGLLPLAVAVLDAGGQEVSYRREDGCGVLRHDIAHGKAWGALGMGMATRQIRDRLANRPTFQAALAAASGGALYSYARWRTHHQCTGYGNWCRGHQWRCVGQGRVLRHRGNPCGGLNA